MEYLDLARHIAKALEEYGYTRLYVEELSLKAGYSMPDSRVLVRKGLTDVIDEAIHSFAGEDKDFKRSP